MNLIEKVKKISEDKKTQTITPRELLEYFGFHKRTSGNCQQIDKFLKENSLELSADYREIWIGEEIELRHKEIAQTRMPKDPVKRVRVLEAANRKPVYVSNSDSLKTAVTVMQLNRYSQLPVTNHGDKDIRGYISWESISEARFNGEASDYIKDYVKEDIQIIKPETPLLDAIKVVYQHDFAVVIGKDKSLQGIITTADISSEFLLNIKPFLLLEEIEKSLRVLLDGSFLLEDIKKVCGNTDKEILSIDDLSFGHYKCIIENPDLWNKLQIKADRKKLIERIEEVRKVRNDIMHFNPDGIDDDAMMMLDNTSKFLSTLIKYKHQNVKDN